MVRQLEDFLRLRPTHSAPSTYLGDVYKRIRLENGVQIPFGVFIQRRHSDRFNVVKLTPDKNNVIALVNSPGAYLHPDSGAYDFVGGVGGAAAAVPNGPRGTNRSSHDRRQAAHGRDAYTQRVPPG